MYVEYLTSLKNYLFEKRFQIEVVTALTIISLVFMTNHTWSMNQRDRYLEEILACEAFNDLTPNEIQYIKMDVKSKPNKTIVESLLKVSSENGDLYSKNVSNQIRELVQICPALESLNYGSS